MNNSEISNDNFANLKLDENHDFLSQGDNISLLASNTENITSTYFEDQSDYLSLTEQEIIQNQYYQEDLDKNTFLIPNNGENKDLQDDDYRANSLLLENKNNDAAFSILGEANNSQSELESFDIELEQQYIENPELALNRQALIVAGQNNQKRIVTLSLLSGESDYRNEIGLFLVDDETGKIGDLSPSSPGYAAAALSSERQILAMFQGNHRVNAEIDGGSYIGSYLIQNSTRQNFLSKNPSNKLGEEPIAFFNFTATNPDNFEHLKTDNQDKNSINLAWEDLTGGGDLDFNDLVVQLSLTARLGVIEGIKWQDLDGDGVRNGVSREVNVNNLLEVKENNNIFLPGQKNQKRIATLSVLSRQADYGNEIGLFLVDDETGKIGDLSPSSPGYAAAALSSERHILAMSQENHRVSAEIDGGSYIGSYLIQNSTRQNFLSKNPSNKLGEEPIAFFNFTATNPDNFEHLKTDSLDKNSINLAWEDLTGGGDLDFNDLVVQLSLADTSAEIVQDIDSESAEPGLAGVQIYLDLNNNSILDNDEPFRITSEDDPNTQDSDETGKYRFTGLEPGTYIVREAGLNGYEQTSPKNGHHVIEIEAGAVIRNIDFGNVAVNQPPTIISTPEIKFDLSQKNIYTYQVEATDVDSESLIYTLLNKPEGAEIDENGLISFIPKNPIQSSYSFEVEVSDGQGGVDTQSFVIEVVQERVIIVTIPEAQTIGEDQNLEITGISISDRDSEELEVNLAVNNGVISLAQTTGLSLTTGDGREDNNIAFTGSLADINNSLANLTYRSNSNYNGDDAIIITVGDGELEETKTIPVTVIPVNDAPILTVPDVLTVEEDAELNITGISVNDIDVGSEELAVTLVVSNGVVSLNQTTGLNLINGDGVEDSNITFTGKLTDINNAIANLTYLGNSNFNGDDAVIITVSDGELEATKTIPITITPVNDAPILNIPGSQTVPEATELKITGISVNDIDVGSEELEVTLVVSNGVISLNQTTGLNLTTGDGVEDSNITFTGTLTDINNAIANLTYLGNSNFNGDDAITITVNDLGNTSAGGELTDSKTIPITITSVNQPPVTDPDRIIAVADDGSIFPLNINAPIDSDGDTLTIKVDEIPNVDKGTVQLADGTTVTVGQELTIADLTGLEFIPVIGETGIAGNFIYTADDGQGGTDNQTISFNITPVIILLEGNSFRVSESQEITIPNESSVLRFTYSDLSFDTTTKDFINDAFEAALIDNEGNSLVHTIDEGQDSFFNLTEDNTADLAPGVTIDGQTVSVNLADITSGTKANLVLRLVNDDGDTTTTVTISNIELETVADLQPPTVIPESTSINNNQVIDFERLSDVSNSIQTKYEQTSFNEDEEILFAEVSLQNIGTYGINAPLLVAVNNISDPTVTVVNGDGLTPEGLSYFDFSDLVDSGQLDPSELTISKAISFNNPSGEQFTYELIVLSELNAVPVIESEPNIEIIGGLTYSYDVDATDADGDSLTHELLIAPAGMSIDSDTGEISWETTTDDIANHNITVQVSDRRGGVTQQNFVLSVIETPPNRPPLFTTSPVVDAYINQLYRYDANAIDPDLDPLSFNLILGSEGMSINSETGEVEWTPPPILILGDTVLGQIGLPGENDEFTFSGVVGQQIYFDPLQFSGNRFDGNFDVYSPSGQNIVNTNLDSSNNQLVTLTETGNYRIIVDANRDVTGSYGFSVIDLNLTPVVPLDTVIEGQLSPGSEDDIYRFTGNAGQKIFLDSIESSGSLNWVLYDSGNQVVTSSGGFTDLELYLPNDGEYVLAIRGTGNLTDITTYAFEIITPDEITAPMSLGSNDNPNSVFGEITEKGEEDFYTFEGITGQRIYFDRLFLDSTFSSSHTVTIVSPSGQSVLNRNFFNGDATTPVYLPEDGTYLVKIDAFGEATGSYSFNLLDVGLATPANLDTEYSDTLDVGEETHLYGFNGTEGQRIFIDSPGGIASGTWTVYNSANKQVAGNFSLNSDIEIVLDTTDTYILAIKGNNGDNPVNYNFQIITPEIVTETLALDTDITNAITEKGEQDIYTFTGSVGQRLFLDTLIDRSDFRATLVSPSGQNIINNVQMDDDDDRSPVLLPEAGTYKLIIDGSGEAIGEYGFNLIDVSAKGVLETETLTSGVLDPGKSIQFYQFTGNEGERIYFDNQANSSGASWYLFNGSNNRLTSASLNDFEYVLPADGIYYLMLLGESDTPIDYNIQLVATTPAITPLTINSSVAGEITKLGEQDVFTFEGTVGQTLYLDSRLDNSNFTFILESPSGKQIFSQNSNSDREPVTLTEPGTYQLTVDGNSDSIGNYNFLLSDTGIPLSFGSTFDGSLNARETILYEFNGTAGQQLEFDSLSADSGADWVLYASTNLLNRGNKQVGSVSLNGDFTVTLPVDGSYILALRNNSDSDVSYEVQVNDISVTTVVNSDIETLRVGSISVAGEIDNYTFTANAGTLIYFDGQSTNSGIFVRLYNLDSSQVFNSQAEFDRGAIFLAQTGDYTLEVHGNDSSNNTGDYRFQLIDLKTSPDINFNTQQDISLNSRETKAFKFAGTAGQKIWLDSLNQDNPNVTITLLNSSGRSVTNTNSQNDSQLQTLEASGEYYVVLQSNNNAATTASFRLLDNINAIPITLDTEISGNFGDSKNESQLYRFDGVAGQQLYFDRIDGDRNNNYYLYDPAGQQVFFQELIGDREGITLPSDGEYILVFEGNDFTSNNNFALEVVTPEFTTTPLTIGEVITNEISKAGEKDTYTFEGTIGQQLWLDELAGDRNLTATLFSPSGDRVFNTRFGYNGVPFGLDIIDDNSDRHVLTETGTYKLVIDSSGDTKEAPYSFRLLDFADATPVDLDTVISGDFGDSQQEAQLYRFGGNEGQKLYFDRKEGDRNNQYHLYNPAGQKVFSEKLSNDRDVIDLPSDGEYILVVEGSDRTNNNYALEVVTPEFTTASLTIGEVVTNEISEAGETDTYTFEGTIGQQLWLDELVGNSNVTATLFSPSGERVFSSNFGSYDDNSDRQVLTETGTYRLVIDGFGDTKETPYSFRLLDFADATPVDLDTEISGNFGDSKQEAQLYRFSGTEEQKLYFDRIDGDFNNRYHLYNPAGQRLFSEQLSDRDLVTLPSDGEYTLVFEGSNLATNNNYALEIVTPEFTTAPLTLGETITNEISEAGEEDTYIFEGTIGQQLWLDELVGNSSVSATLYSPSGERVFSSNFGSLDDSSDRQVLTETGTYRLVIDGSGDTKETPYSFRLLDFADATPVSLDTVISGDFGESKQEAQLYRFSGTEEQKLYFDRIDGSFSNLYHLYNPAGQLVFFERLGSDHDVISLPTDGEYTLVFEGDNSATNNNYALEIVTPEFTTAPLTIGDRISNEISEAGEEDTYTFEGTIGQQLFLDALVGNSNWNAQLYSPSGNVVVNLTLNTFNNTALFTLTEAGTYRLVIDANNDATGDYSFKLSDRAEVTALELDTAIVGTLESGNQVELYQFTGNKGTVLNFDLDATFLSGANWVLYDPNNGVLAQPSSSSPDFEVALPSDGLYTLAIVGNSNTAVNYNFQVTDNSVAPIPITGTNITVTGEITNAGDIDSYTFEASAGTLIWLDRLNSTGFDIRARLKNPDGTFAFTNHATTSELGAILLTQTGEYTLETFGFNNSSTGNWQFQLLELPADQQSAAFNSLTLNSTIEETLSPGNAAKVYSFDGTIGQQILFNGINGDAVDAYLYDPNGQQVFNINNFRTRNTDIFTLKQEGIYHLVIDGNSNENRNFSFELSDFAFGSELTPNLPVQGSLTSSRATDMYRISGEQNQRLFFDINTGSSLARIKVYNANNQELLKDVSLITSSSFDLTVPQDGEYIVYLESNNISAAIDYEFQVFAYDDDSVADIIVPGTGDSASNDDGSLGLFPVQLQVEDDRDGTALQDFNIRLLPDPENTAPQIVSIPLQTQVGLNQEGYSYQLESIDPDGDTLSYRLLDAPLGTLIDRDTGELLWFPTESAVAGEIYNFTVEVSDSRGGSDSQSFGVEVFDTLGTIQGAIFEDLNQNGIPDTSLLKGEDPDIFFVIDVSGSMGSSTVNWSTADLNTTFEEDLSPLDQELGSILAFSEFLIAQGRGNESEIGIATSGQNVIDMNPAEPGIQVSTTPLADNNNNGIRDIREVITGGVGGGSSDTSGIRKAWEVQQTLSGDSNIIFMSDGFIGVDDDLIAEVKADGVNITAFGFALEGLDTMRRVDPDAVYISNPQEIGNIFSGFDPRYIAEPLLESVTVYLDINNNGVLDNGEPQQITKKQDQTNYYFSFNNLVPGIYNLRQVVPDGYVETAPDSSFFIDTITAEEETFTHFLGIHQISDPPNQDPTFTSIIPGSEIILGEQFIYQATAIDPNLDTLTFDLPLAPEGMVVNPETGYLVWNPTELQTGEHTAIVRVQDGRGGADIQYLEFSVQPPNKEPVFISSLENNTPQVGKPFQYQAKATDLDGDTLTYELIDAPSNVTINAATGLINWTPNSGDLGEREFQVKVTDGKGGEALQELNLNIIEATPNNAPNITSNPANQARVNNLYVYQLEAEDIDGDPLNFNLTDAPDGMTIDNQGRITWNSDASQLGEHTVEVLVEDGQGGIDSQTFTLDVNNRVENGAPSITSSPNTFTNTERVYQYQGTAIDPDGDYFVWSLKDAPQGMVIDETTGVLSWQPDATQIGEYTIAVQVTDTLGLAVIQTFTLSVTGSNTPPLILSIPPTRAGLNQAYTYQVAARDPENDPLRFSLGVRPEGMTIDETTGEIQWTPTSEQDGSFTVEVIVADTQDGIGRQTYTLEVGTTAINQPPTIDSKPGFFADITSTYSYQVVGNDPEGGALTYSLLNAPSGMTIDADGLIEWNPNSSQLGVAQVSIVAFDSSGLGAVQTYNLQVQSANNAPIINSNPVLSAAPETTYRYDVRANDPDREQITYTLNQAPEGMEIDELGRITWNPGTGDLGNYDIEVVVTDSRGATDTQTYNLEVAADTQAPQVNLEFDRDRANIGDEVTFQVTATDNIGVEQLNLVFNGTNIALDGNGRAKVKIDTAGSFNAIASATDASGNTGSDTTTIFGIDPSDVNAPVVSINSVVDGQIITATTDITGTITDDNLTFYSLGIASVDSDNFTEIARGTNPVTDSLLGKFDPSTLLNDEYTLRLLAQDAGGNISTDELNISVEGELKVGNYQLSFTDLTIPVAGIPIVLSRTYDSFNANNIDDFGYGWRMELRDTDLRTSVAKSGLEEELIYNPFFTGARVYITTPGGGREGFTFEPQPAPGLKGSFLGIWEPRFVPDAGVTSQLTVENADLLRTNTGEFLGYGSSRGYNPSSPAFGGTYTLTTQEGIAYRIDGDTGDTRTVSDRNGNELTFTDGGVFSSTGQSITFERDAQNRITAAIDPQGNRIEYEYDANGDLVTVIDREGNETKFDYNDNLAHYLEEIIDPLGRTGARSEYDEEGRLVKIIDADGEAVELIHDPDNFVETVKDQLGNETIYEYDDLGNVVNQIDAEGGVTRSTYDDPNNPTLETSITDPNGNTTTFTYDNRGNVLTETDPEGNVTTFTYDSFGNVLTTTDAQGNTTTNNYDSNGNLTSISGQANGTTTLNYDSSGNLSSFNDGAGTTSFEYDGSGNVTRQVDAEGNETTFTYDENGNQLTETRTLTTPNGVITLVTTTEYDSEGRVLKVTDPEGGVTETKYDAVGNRIEEIDALGRSTKFVYDERGLLIETIYPDSTPNNNSDNPRTRTEYDAAGQVIAEINELGRKTQFVYDKLGRQIETILPDETPNDNSDNPRTRTEYDAAGQVTTEIDQRGNRTEFVYDQAGRRIETILPDETPNDNSDNPRFTNTYNDAGRQTAQTDALGNITKSLYDDLGRPTGQEFADGTTVSSEFDDSGRLIARTDQDGEVTRYEYDASSRLTAVIDALDQRTEYSYDEQGNLITQKDANGNITKFEYDSLNRRIATELPEGQRSTTEYNQIGNVISTTDFNGDTITYEYDDRDRLITKNFPDGSTTTYTYNLVGQRETVVDERGTITYDYDAQGFLIKRIEPDGKEINYTYDEAGNRTSVEIASGDTAYTYDELNRLQTVIDADGGVTTYEYNDNSNLISTQFPNGTVETRQYDNLNRLTYIETKDSSDNVISSFLYELDAEGNRTQVTEHDGRIVKYYYDDLDRLEKEEIFDPGAIEATRTIEYIYDEVGNRLSRVDSVDGTTIYTYDNNDRLEIETTNGVATTYTYDDNGNTISKTTGTDTVTYEWDAENRLVGADTNGDGTVDVTNQYDADGVRVAQTVNGEETRYLIDTNRPYAQVLEEYTDGGIIKVSYVHGNDLISQDRNGDRSFYHVDGLGSTRALSNESGNASDRYIYDAFGQVLTKIGDTDNSYLYAGEQRDSNLGLDYLRARYLDVETGRFNSRDSFSGFQRQPVSLHDYLYANASPTQFTDPSGFISLGELSTVQGIQNNLSALSKTIKFEIYRAYVEAVENLVLVTQFATLAGLAFLTQPTKIGGEIFKKSPRGDKAAISKIGLRVFPLDDGYIISIAVDFGKRFGKQKTRININTADFSKSTAEVGLNYPVPPTPLKVGGLDLLKLEIAGRIVIGKRDVPVPGYPPGAVRTEKVGVGLKVGIDGTFLGFGKISQTILNTGLINNPF